MLSGKKRPNEVVNDAAEGREENACNRFYNSILQPVIVQAEALLVEDARDFLARVLEVLQVSQHGHAQILHLHDILTREHLAVTTPFAFH